MKLTRTIMLVVVLAAVLGLCLGAPAQATTAVGFDTSRWTKNPDDLINSARAHGYQFIGTYITSPGKPAKVLTKARLDACMRAGMPVVLFFEESARRPLSGYKAGVKDARKVIAALAKLGLPRTTPVYFCCDCGAVPARVAAYYQGVKDTFGFAQGGYGGGIVITYLLDHGLIHWACQTWPWSKKGADGHVIWDPRLTLKQPGIGVKVAYRACDVLWAEAADFGQIPRP